MITFVLPTYNRASTVGLTIKSILNQSLDFWELIIVDDGSTDDTYNQIKAFLSDSRIKYFYNENSGVSAARNFGLLKSKGEYIIFIDSDDQIGSNLLQELLLKKFDDYDLICWETQEVFGDYIKIVKPNYLGNFYNNYSANFLAGSICYRKTVLDKVGGYDERMSYGENYELGLRICNMNEKLNVLIINEIFLKYFKVEQRTSNSVENRLNSLIVKYKKHYNLYKANYKQHSKILYNLAYLLEKSQRYKSATLFYFNAWCVYPLNIKYLVKYIFTLKRKYKFF